MSSFEERRKEILSIDRPGWGWVVVLAASGLFALQAGGFKCAGVILVEMIEEYDGVYSPSLLLWVFTVKWVVVGLLGPVTSLLIVKTTHRHVAMLGVTLMTLSYIGLAYSRTIYTMIAFHSLVGGLGEGMVFIPAMLASAPYFDKHRASALGITACGSGLGTLILPYVIRAFYDNYDYRGATLLYGGFALNFMVLASLLRPISYYERIHAKELKECEEEYRTSQQEDRKPEINGNLEIHGEVNSPRIRSVSFNGQGKHNSDTKTFLSHSNIKQNNQHSNGYLLQIPSRTEQKPSLMVSLGDLGGSIYFESAANISKLQQCGQGGKKEKEKLNIKVMLMPRFLILAFSILTYALGMSVIYGLLPSLGKEWGIPKDTIALMMLLGGIIEMPCRIMNGILADRHYMTAFHQMVIYIFGAGISALLCTFITGVPGIAVVLVGLSTMGTSIFSLLPPALRELIGEENVTSGMGFQMVFQACGFIISSFIVGQIYDSTGSWIYIYYYIAGIVIISSMISWPYVIYHKRPYNCTEQQSGSELTDSEIADVKISSQDL